MAPNVTLDDYPLLSLFTRLREAGLPLGLGKYRLLLQALQGGYGLPDRATLKRLCCCLWIKSPEERAIFDYHFERLFVAEANTEQTTPEAQTSLQPKSVAQCWPRYAALALVCCLVLIIPRSRELFQQPSALLNAVPLANPEEPAALPSPEVPLPSPQWELPPLVIWGVAFALISIGTGLTWWLLVRRRQLAKKSSSPDLPEQTETTPLFPELTDKSGDEVQAAQAIQQTTARNKPVVDKRFGVKAEYFPITRRQMKQSWRYLRCAMREGPKTELDVAATVAQIGHQGGLLDPVFVARRANRTELLLLIDRDGSMVPFHRLSDRLVETALQAGRLGNAGAYYFYNCPQQYVYRDPYHQKAAQLDRLLSQLPTRRTVALIFSDAGAARGNCNPSRVKATARFLKNLQPQVRSLVWLNPLPSFRWAGWFHLSRGKTLSQETKDFLELVSQ